MTYHIYNAGPVALRRVSFFFIEEQSYVTGALGIGLLRPGDYGLVRTQMPPSKLRDGTAKSRGVVLGVDGDGITWAWVVDTDGRRKINTPLRRRLRWWRRHVVIDEVVERVYKDTDVAKLTQLQPSSQTQLEREDGRPTTAE